jgi:hypothetical protein
VIGRQPHQGDHGADDHQVLAENIMFWRVLPMKVHRNTKALVAI